MIMTTENIQGLIKLCYALSGVIAIVGAIDVYVLMNIDDKRARKAIIATVIFCVAFIALAHLIENLWL